MQIQIINCTPHSVQILTDADYDKERNIFTTDNPVVKYSFAPSGIVTRVAQSEKVTGTILSNVPVVENQFGQIFNLPAEKPNTIYIVSAIVLTAAKAIGRQDCMAPARLVRDQEGRVIGCLALQE